MRGFFSCWTRKEQISRRGVMACRNSMSLSFPERNRGAGMILPSKSRRCMRSILGTAVKVRLQSKARV